MKRILYLFIFFVLLVIGITFAVLNAEPVGLNYYFGSKEIELSIILVITLIIGAILGILASANLFLSHRREIIRLKKAMDLAEKEINNLRSIPIRDKH